jgi:hypothetical protein
MSQRTATKVTRHAQCTPIGDDRASCTRPKPDLHKLHSYDDPSPSNMHLYLLEVFSGTGWRFCYQHPRKLLLLCCCCLSASTSCLSAIYRFCCDHLVGMIVARYCCGVALGLICKGCHWIIELQSAQRHVAVLQHQRSAPQQHGANALGRYVQHGYTMVSYRRRNASQLLCKGGITLGDYSCSASVM